MLRKTTKSNLILENIFKTVFVAVLFLSLPILALAQKQDSSQSGSDQQAVVKNDTQAVQTNEQKNSVPILVPVLKSYKEVAIGMPSDEVRNKLGKPELDDQKSLFYRFSEDESAQILFDADKKVRIISMMYVDRNGTAPKPADIFGADVEITPNEEGALYKMVRYPEAGYVVVYSRSAGANPMVIVTMQKI